MKHIDTTRTFRTAATTLAAGAALLLSAASLQAQEEGDLSLGAFGGGYLSSALNDTDEGEFFNDGAPADLELEMSGMTGLQAEYWFDDRVAVRAEGGYAPATLQVDQPDSDLVPDSDGSREIAETDVWVADVNAMLRLLPEESTVTPFVSAGAGFVSYAPEGEDAIVIDDANARVPDGDDGGTEGNDDTLLAGMIGVGADFSPEGWPVAIRGEVTDHISSSPAGLFLNGTETPIDGGAGVEGDDDFGVVHNLRFTLGLQWVPGDG